MAIITADIWKAWANKSIVGPELTALTTLCSQMDAAIKNKLKRTIEQATYTLVLDAPMKASFQLFRWAPILVDGFELSKNLLAKGDPSAFDADDVLTMYEDYFLQTGQDDTTQSGSGLVWTANNTYWGVDYYRPPHSVSLQRTPVRGGLKVTFTGGYATVPADLQEAACLAISRLRGQRRLGVGVSSESWNGESYSLPAGSVEGILNDPDIHQILSTYMNYAAIIG